MSSIANFVQQKTVSTGTGALLLSAVTASRGFASAFGIGGNDMFFYFIRHRSAPEWEVGTGHMADAATLVRDHVISSSSSGAKVAFSAGEKDVVNDIAAERQMVLPAAPSLGDMLVFDGLRWQAAKPDMSSVAGLTAALAGKAGSSHAHTLADVNGLSAALNAKAAAAHSHATSDITGLAALLGGKAGVSHSHAIGSVTGLQDALDAKAPASRSIATSGSLSGGGDLGANRTFSLNGDDASPGNGKYYGTDSGGVKGFHTLPAAAAAPDADDVPFDAESRLLVTGANVQTALQNVDNALQRAGFHPSRTVSFNHFTGSDSGPFIAAVTGTGANAATIEGDYSVNTDALGVFRMTTGTTASGAAWRSLGTAAVMLHADQKVLRLKSRIRLANLTASGTQEFRAWGGITVNTAANTNPASAIGMYWYYDKDNTRWVLRRRNAGFVYDAVTDVTVEAGVWYDMELVVNGAVDDNDVMCELFINGVSKAVNSQLIGSMGYNVVSAAIQKAVGTTARLMYIDYEALFLERGA